MKWIRPCNPSCLFCDIGVVQSMSRFLAVLALALFASVRPAMASDSEAGAAACQTVAEAALFDYEIPAEKVALCNANEHCADAKRLIGVQHGKLIPALTCADAGHSSPQAAAKFVKATYDNACAAAGVVLAGGSMPGNLQKRIALCNRSPDKTSCREILIFLQSARKNPRGMTCK